MENINVYIRLKPLENQNDSHFTYDTKKISDSKTNEIYSFDHIISPSETNEEIFTKYMKQNIPSLFKGINITLFLYGQTTSGKTHTMKGGDPTSNDGFIHLCLKEIFNMINNSEHNITKSVIKISYCEIYNENINDLIDTSKKNLELKESPKGAYINNLSVHTVINYDKTIEILNKSENSKNASNDKLNKANNIFKVNIEFNINEKKYISRLNLVELSGSENILKPCGNINKSIIAFNNVINKLSQNNNKVFVNYKDSKLTKILQSSFNSNTKIYFICTIIDDNEHYTENLNTIKFGIKAKSIKISVKPNEINNDKKNNSKENQALRNKIKLLEKIIHDKKSMKENKSNNKNNSILMTANKNKNNSNKKYNELLKTVNKKDEQISNLEKEVSMLKQYLMNNEEMGSDIGSIQSPQDWMNTQGDIYSNIYNMNNMSAYKSSFKQRISNLSAIRGSGSAIKSSFFNSPIIPRHHQSEFYSNSNINQIEGFNNNNFKRNLCMTEMRPPANIPKNYFHSAIRKTAPQNNNFLFGSNTKIPIPDLTMNNPGNNNNDYLMRENEELKNSINELKNTYNEVVKSKEQQIMLINQNHDMTLENCEKLIKEAESNYMKLKTEYDQTMEKIKLKDNELNELKKKNMNQNDSINYYMNELNKMKDVNYASEIEGKYNSLLEENIKLKQKEEKETIKLKEENDLLKKNIDMIDSKYKEKCKELNENQKKNNDDKKQIEKELQKCRIELKNFRNTQAKKISKSPLKNTNQNINNKNSSNIDNDKIKDYEEQITKLMEENAQYKTNLEKIEKTQIPEYQKLLDDSFAKIAQLNKEINDAKDKNKYLEKALNIVEKTARKENLNFSSYNTKESLLFGSNGDNKDFLNKKRKMPKIYQDVIDNQQMNKSNEQVNNININTPNKDCNNLMNIEFSNFEI